MISELNQRSREVFREIVEAYVQTGEPVGSRTLSRRLTTSLSPATIRNVMADLEDLGLLMAPHTSAGRVPTDAGLRLFVNGILEIGALTEKERSDIEARCVGGGRSMPEMLEEATNLLSGLSSCAGLVLAPKTDRPLKHIEFINLSPGRALVVLVTEDGLVENRVVEVAVGLPPSALQMASNYLNARVVGRTLAEARAFIQKEMEDQKSQLDALTAKVVETGLATWAGTRDSQGYLIVRGQARLLEDVTALSDLERIRNLFEALETREQMMRMLDATGKADGVQIFIGAESELFSHAGCSMIVSPYMNTKEQIVGAIGVIGPARINYARIIPMVDYTAKVIGRLMG
jgi:heat-inducible transcriptional repressor